MDEIIAPAVYRTEVNPVAAIVSRVRSQFPGTVRANIRVRRVYDRQQTPHLVFGQPEPKRKMYGHGRPRANW